MLNLLLINQVGFVTYLIKDFSGFLKIWRRTIFSSVMSVSMYFLVFGAILQDRIGMIEGGGYITFIIPGIIIMPCVTLSFISSFSSFLSSVITREIESLILSPMLNCIIVLSIGVAGAIRGVAISLSLLFLSFIFMPAPKDLFNIVFFVIFIFLFSLVFSFIGLLLSFLTNKVESATLIITLLFTPLIYLGGVFFPISDLPTNLQRASYYNPIYHIVNASRDFFIEKNVSLMGCNIFYLLMFVFSFFILCCFIFSYKIKRN